jgi:predicted MFS family arabinose efflux permease
VTQTTGRAREVLARRDFRSLLTTRVTSQFGDGLFQAVLVASVIFSPDRQSTTVGFAKAVAILALPFSAAGPFAGVLIDRWSRRRILVGTPVARAVAALLVLPGASAPFPFYAGALLVLSANRFFLVTAGAVTPDLVDPDDLLTANAVATTGGTLATFLGVVVGGQLADAFGSGPVAVAASIGWVVSAWMASRIRANLTPERRETKRPLGHDIRRVVAEVRSGAARLRASRPALAGVGAITVEQFLQGLILVISLVVFRERFGEGVGSFSWLVAAGGVGLLTGLVTVGWLVRRTSRRGLISGAFLVSGLPLIATAFAINRISVLVASYALGLSFAWKKVPADTIIQESIADEYRGRVLSIYDMSFNVARVLSALLAIVLLAQLPLPLVVALTGVGFLVCAPVVSLWLRPRSGLVVRTYSGGRADEAVRSVVVGGVEHAVVEQRSWREERGGTRVLRFGVTLDDGRRLTISRRESEDAWVLDRENKRPEEGNETRP